MVASVAAYGWPFAALLGAGRLLEYVQNLALVLVPPRWWREVVEVPLALAACFLLLKAAVHRLQDLLPLAAYLELSAQEKQEAAAAAAEAGVDMAAATAATGAAAVAVAAAASASAAAAPGGGKPAAA
ncbi:hypothetical protein HXX76_011835 [Chlamydomonas incerta]|uniref:Uncharacterized protein n=1 Tax=Chlamydomonas incerta TaxID=51695 RepID=A0A835VUB8_CHLIN|nr:hypothetical protein HXX76_011835 [Chlamydomonas incerta]|eukprot:KAG2428155.1 hypothetical protein HXX76_011835 [Chlamydomonas incerta]